jgi:predicted enzyme related to lactoylglutathione lyase
MIRLRASAHRTLLFALAIFAACSPKNDPDLSSMSFSEDPLVGKVVWNDLITEDIDAARRFYGELFGWTFETSTRSGGREYVLARSGDVYVAGLVPVDPPADGSDLSRWVPYVSVADVDSSVSRAVADGGSVAVTPLDVSLGRVAVIVDPEGAVIGLARSDVGDPDDRTTAAAPGRIVWTEMLSDDPPTAAAFYESVVGYDVKTVQRRGGIYTMLANRGIDRAGILRNPDADWDPVWLTYIGVADPAAAAARVESLGGEVLLAVSPEVREGSLAVVADPSGAVLVLQKTST